MLYSYIGKSLLQTLSIFGSSEKKDHTISSNYHINEGDNIDESTSLLQNSNNCNVHISSPPQSYNYQSTMDSCDNPNSSPFHDIEEYEAV